MKNKAFLMKYINMSLFMNKIIITKKIAGGLILFVGFASFTGFTFYCKNQMKYTEARGCDIYIYDHDLRKINKNPSIARYGLFLNHGYFDPLKQNFKMCKNNYIYDYYYNYETKNGTELHPKEFDELYNNVIDHILPYINNAKDKYRLSGLKYIHQEDINNYIIMNAHNELEKEKPFLFLELESKIILRNFMRAIIKSEQITNE